jgi:hypothetical protein
MPENQSIVPKKITENLQLVIAFGAVIGLAVGVINFFILTNVSPLEKRVDAIEKRNDKVDPLFDRFLQLEERDAALIKDVEEIKFDIRAIRDYLNIR